MFTKEALQVCDSLNQYFEIDSDSNWLMISLVTPKEDLIWYSRGYCSFQFVCFISKITSIYIVASFCIFEYIWMFLVDMISCNCRSNLFQVFTYLQLINWSTIFHDPPPMNDKFFDTTFFTCTKMIAHLPFFWPTPPVLYDQSLSIGNSMISIFTTISQLQAKVIFIEHSHVFARFSRRSREITKKYPDGHSATILTESKSVNQVSVTVDTLIPLSRVSYNIPYDLTQCIVLYWKNNNWYLLC